MGPLSANDFSSPVQIHFRRALTSEVIGRILMNKAYCNDMGTQIQHPMKAVFGTTGPSVVLCSTLLPVSVSLGTNLLADLSGSVLLS